MVGTAGELQGFLTHVVRSAVVVAGLAAVVGGCGGGHHARTSSAPQPLASIDGEATGQLVDGIKCEESEQVLFHIHAHLAAYVDGARRVIPEGIGIAPPRQVAQTPQGPFVAGGRCFYWLHGHTADGIVHIESPVARTYTLGNYFDIWRQPLARDRVGPALGPVTAYLNGRLYAGDPRSIPLTAHALVQLDVGAKVAPAPFTFPQGL
jgi:hypothetical protein